MKYLFTALFCLLFATVSAETIWDVEYHLPPEAQDWEITKELLNRKGTVLVYTPKGVNTEQATEFFGINASYIFLNVKDAALIKFGLVKMYPDLQIDLTVLEKFEDGTLYEWTAKANGIEKMHSWDRAFSTSDGTVVLSYQTQQIEDVPTASSIWLPVLKEATCN